MSGRPKRGATKKKMDDYVDPDSLEAGSRERKPPPRVPTACLGVCFLRGLVTSFLQAELGSDDDYTPKTHGGRGRKRGAESDDDDIGDGRRKGECRARGRGPRGHAGKKPTPLFFALPGRGPGAGAKRMATKASARDAAAVAGDQSAMISQMMGYAATGAPMGQVKKRGGI